MGDNDKYSDFYIKVAACELYYILCYKYKNLPLGKLDWLSKYEEKKDKDKLVIDEEIENFSSYRIMNLFERIANNLDSLLDYPEKGTLYYSLFENNKQNFTEAEIKMLRKLYIYHYLTHMNETWYWFDFGSEYEYAARHMWNKMIVIYPELLNEYQAIEKWIFNSDMKYCITCGYFFNNTCNCNNERNSYHVKYDREVKYVKFDINNLKKSKPNEYHKFTTVRNMQYVFRDKLCNKYNKFSINKKRKYDNVNKL